MVVDALTGQLLLIKERIQKLEADYILKVNEEDLVSNLVTEFTLDIPVLDESGIQVDYGEHQIDVSGDPERRFSSTPFYVAGTRVTFSIPFTGDVNLFNVQPRQFAMTLSGSGSKTQLDGNEIRITYAAANLDAQGARRNFDAELARIKQNLVNLNESIARHNGGLETLIDP